MTSKELAQRLKSTKATEAESRNFSAVQKRQHEATIAKAKEGKKRVPKILAALLSHLEQEPVKRGQAVDVMDVGSYTGDWNLPDPGKLSGTAREVYDLLDAASSESRWYPFLDQDFDMVDNRYMMIKVRYGVPHRGLDTRQSSLVD